MRVNPLSVRMKLSKVLQVSLIVSVAAVLGILAHNPDGQPGNLAAASVSASQPDFRSRSASAASQPVAAATVVLDPSFDGDGRVTTDFASDSDIGTDVVMQPDGKIVAVGYSARFGSDHFSLARYNLDGSLDTSFGTGGKAAAYFSASSRAWSVALQPDGKIVVAGHAGSVWDFAMARFNPDGTLDTSFGTGGKVTTDFATIDDQAFGVDIQSDGKIVLAGYANVNNAGSVRSNFALARYNPNGSLDSSFGVGGKVMTDFDNDTDQALAMRIQPDGKIVAAGMSFRTSGGNGYDVALARYNQDGSLDSSFGVGGKVSLDFGSSTEWARSLAFDSNGMIVVAGTSLRGSGTTYAFAVGRVTAEGSPDSSFGTNGRVITEFPGPDDQAFDVVIQPDNKIVAAGYSEVSAESQPPTDMAMVRYNPDGSLDTSFGDAGRITTDFSNGNDFARGILLQPDNKLVIAGYSVAGFSVDFALARYLNDVIVLTATPTTTPTDTPTATPTCGPTWSHVPSPYVEPIDNTLQDVAAISANDIWAVGQTSYSGNPNQTLIIHWNGSEWAVVPSPNPGSYHSLHGVVAFSSNDVWAVGSYTNGAGYLTLVLHWNGTEWAVVPSPSPGTNNNFLRAVAGTGSSDIWAVGYYLDRFSSIDRTLVLHWNGTEWSVVPSPSPGPDDSYLEGVTAISANDAWAVGHTLGPGQGQTLTLHWNGTGWAVVPSPSPGATGNTLEDVEAVSANDVWAVGQSYSTSPTRSLALHWNGTEWAVVPSPNPGLYSNGLRSVAITAANDVWALGLQGGISYLSTLAIHWNGSEWSVEPSPNLGIGGNLFNGAAAVGPNDVWGVGYYEPNGPRRTLVQRYVETCGTPTMMPTNTATVTNIPTSTSTSAPTYTRTNTPVMPTSTVAPPTAPMPCTMTFTDVPDTNTFYQFIRCLACRGIISGYSDGTFRPNNEVTRGQLAKIVSNAAGFTENPNPQIFEDVPPSSTFYQWINRLTRRGYMSGYVCGGRGEPCLSGMPYFRPSANATRGQTSKIVSNAAGYTEIPTEQTFEDVPPTHAFYREIQRLASRNIMGGYPCGGPGEPCVSGKPYFRPQNNVTRGQSAKIVSNTFFPGCTP